MRQTQRKVWMLPSALAVSVLCALIDAPAASAFSGGSLVPVGLFGLPSLHSIIQAIARGFFGALAGALVPSWLKHGTVATIQHLVALPDPASWSHVSALQGDMTYLAEMLLPVTLAVGAVRYWLIGLTGAAHPASAIVRCTGATGVLVLYRWIVEETVAATNTLTHGILGLPAVSDGLQRIIGVLFGGALLSGAGGVFGAFLVIIGVVFAAGLFAAQVLLTVLLAVLIVAGPPLIALSAIPELSHLARDWAHALIGVALVPLGWTVLFATAGALCLDATSFTGAGGGLPGHVAAAFAGLITFVIAARLPLMVLGHMQHLFGGHSLPAGGAGQVGKLVAGPARVRAAHARLRAVGLDGPPSRGNVRRAAGARGGAAGAGLRGLGAAAGRTGSFAGGMAGGAAAEAMTPKAGRFRTREAPAQKHGVRAGLARARTVFTGARGETVAAEAVQSVRAAKGGRHPAVAGAEQPGANAEPARAMRRERPGPGRAAGPARAEKAAPPASAAGMWVGGTRSARADAIRLRSFPGTSRIAASAPSIGRAESARRAARDASRPTSTAAPPPRPPEMHSAVPSGREARRAGGAPPRRSSTSTPPPSAASPSGSPKQPPRPQRPAPPVRGAERQKRPKRKPKPRGRP
jgi:uncharacterized membrane protein